MRLRETFAVALLCLTGMAASHRPRVYSNPDLNIFAIAEGPDGLLWLATGDGLYRFDGLHYHKIPQYPFESARFVTFTRDGSLWAGDFPGLVRYRDGQFERVISEHIMSLAASADHVFAGLFEGLVRIGLDGSVHRLGVRPRRDLTFDSEGKLWAICQWRPVGRACAIEPDGRLLGSGIALPTGYEFEQAVRDGRGNIWAADRQRSVRVQSSQIIATVARNESKHSNRAAPLVAGRNGQVWFIGETVRGLAPPVEFQDRRDQDRFTPLSGFEDSNGSLWVGSSGQGLVRWTADPGWRRWFPEDFGNEAPAKVVRDSQGSAVLATEKHLYRYDSPQDRWSRITKEEHFYYAILPLENGEFLASIRDFGLARIGVDGRVAERVPDLVPKDLYREILRDSKGRLWVGTKMGLRRIEGSTGSLRLRHEPLPDIQPDEYAHAVDLELDATGRLWVGYANGIAWLDDQDRWRKLRTDQPVTFVRAFTVAADELWVSHRRPGAFSRLRRDGEQWRVTSFSAADGFGPPNTQYLKRDSRNWIWRGGSQGVHVSDGKRTGPDDWLHMDPRNGLAANESAQYGFFEDSDGSVWITGEEGVTHLRPDVSWFDAPRTRPPQVTRVEADGQMFVAPDSAPSELPANTRVLRVDVGSLHVPSFRDASLRYRLLPGANVWRLSRDGTLQFQNLANGAYSLEVGYAGNGSSPIATYRFQIGPAGQPVSWFWPVTFATAIGTLVVAVQRAPWFERVRFRIDKTLFLLRRRYRRRQSHSSPSGTIEVRDYSGETLGEHYHLTDVMSRGGFSAVYAARDLRDDSARLAVKVLNRSSRPREDSWVRNRFAHEVAALRSIEHPGIVRVLHSWIGPEGEPCLAMPFLDGPTLRAAMSASTIAPARAGRLTQQLGSALIAVHRCGIVHRDLKPENIMLTRTSSGAEQAIIIDFGTAGLRQAENDLAVTTLMAGSFHYMAPERLTGHYSPASDVFSFGVIILEMLTGKRLSDLHAMFSDAAFPDELAGVLGSRLPGATARAIAELLFSAYHPEPRRRPAPVDAWAGDLASLLDQV